MKEDKKSALRPPPGQWGVRILRSAWQKATTGKLPGDRGDTEKPSRQGAVRLREAQRARAVRGNHLACRGNKIPFAPHTDWDATALDKELPPPFLKLEGKASTGDGAALKWARRGESLVDGRGWPDAAGSCWPPRWPRWGPLPPFPRTELPPEGACCGRRKFSCWFLCDGSKFFYCSLSWIFHGQFS